MYLDELIEKAIEIKNRVGNLEVTTGGLPAELALEEKGTEDIVVSVRPQPLSHREAFERKYNRN